jgi:tRNA nucleotidyltransferase (CCA-adding enzyme)
LYNVWKDNNRTVGDLLYRANIEDFHFMRLVKSVADGKETDIDALIAMAAKAAPHLSLRRGPKISRASATHEFFLEDRLEVMRGPLPEAGPNRPAEYVDALTQATRAEFKNDNFSSRTARERVSRKRLIEQEK